MTDDEEALVVFLEDGDGGALAVTLREWAAWQDARYPIFMANVVDRTPTVAEETCVGSRTS